MHFRNVDTDENDPVATWPEEAIENALERGSLSVWHRLAAAIDRTPWGPVARSVEEVLTHSRPYGVTEVMERVIAHSRHAAKAAARSAVAAELSAHVAASGLTKAQFASRLGTSASRLSTYLSGRVSPSADLLVRARRLSRTPAEQVPRGGASKEQPLEHVADDVVRAGRAGHGSAGA